MNLVEVIVPNPGNSAHERARALLGQAEARTIVTAADYEAASEELKGIKGKWNEIDSSRKTLKKPIDEAAKRIQQFFTGPLDFLARAESILKRKMISFSEEQARIQRAEQAKAEEIARRERERLEAQARKAAEAGKSEKAAALEERAAFVVAPIIHREPPKVAGINTREVWLFEVTDPLAVPREFLIVDESKIRKHVANMKGDTKIAGIRVYSEKRMASGSL